MYSVYIYKMGGLLVVYFLVPTPVDERALHVCVVLRDDVLASQQLLVVDAGSTPNTHVPHTHTRQIHTE